MKNRALRSEFTQEIGITVISMRLARVRLTYESKEQIRM